MPSEPPAKESTVEAVQPSSGKMSKRVVTKDDGRKLIFYGFPSGAKTMSEPAAVQERFGDV